MAKSKTSDSVKVRNGAVEREFPKAQWDQMKSSNETYGWVESSKLPKDLTDKEKQLELSKVDSLQKDLNDSNEQVKNLTSQSEAKDARIAELEKQLESSKTDSKKK